MAEDQSLLHLQPQEEEAAVSAWEGCGRPGHGGERPLPGVRLPDGGRRPRRPPRLGPCDPCGEEVEDAEAARPPRPAAAAGSVACLTTLAYHSAFVRPRLFRLHLFGLMEQPSIYVE